MASTLNDKAMQRWTGKTAVVTGASVGIGAEICAQLAGTGMHVVGLARRPQLVEKLPVSGGGGKIVGRKCDVSKPQEVAEAFAWVEKQFGGVDVLINNAGVLVDGQITELGSRPLSDDDVQLMLDVNVKGLVLSARHAVASMKKRGVAGHIVNINSVAGHYVPSKPIAHVYTATKHAVTAFTTGLATELACTGSTIKTTSVSPGLVDTAMAKELGPALAGAPALRPADVAAAVLYVLSTPPSVNIHELSISHVGEQRV